MEHGTAVSSSPWESRSDVEWHSVLQTKSRDEKLDPGHLLSQLPVEESGRANPAVRGTRIGGPTETLLFVSSLSLLLTSFSSVLREGLPRGTRGGDTPPAFSLWQLGQLVRGTGRRDVHGQNVPLGTIVDTRNKLIQNNSIILEVAGCLESQVERTEGAFAGFPAMETFVQHPVEKEPSRKLSDR